MKNKLTPEEEIDRRIKRRTFISFSVFALAGTGTLGLWNWFRALPKKSNNLSWLSRKALNFNERVAHFFYRDGHLAPTYDPAEAAATPRVNGYLGIGKNFKPGEWNLKVEKAPGKELAINLEELKALPKTEIVFNFKCIEGWSQVVHYAGVRFSDFLRQYETGTRSGKIISADRPEDWYLYVGLETPDKKYFVGIDMRSMLHPQTILCYELNGKDLPLKHGAPLRLITPVKYGVKNLKRIGRIFFSDTRPRDYWYERGYDYDLGL